MFFADDAFDDLCGFLDGEEEGCIGGIHFLLFFCFRLSDKETFYYLCAMRKIIAYKNYFSDFIKKLSKDEVRKIQRALDLFKVEDKLPRHFIKFIRDGIYEFRVTYGNNEFRIFFIYDGDTIVVLFNAFKKKTQKTPNDEINKAIKLKKEYYETKRNKQ